MQGVSLQNHFEKIERYVENAFTLKHVECVLVNVLEPKFGNLGQIDLESILNQFEHVPDLFLIRLLDEDLSCLAELLFSSGDRVLVSSLDKRDD